MNLNVNVFKLQIFYAVDQDEFRTVTEEYPKIVQLEVEEAKAGKVVQEKITPILGNIVLGNIINIQLNLPGTKPQSVVRNFRGSVCTLNQVHKPAYP